MNYPKNRFSKENPCKSREWLYNEYIILDKSSKKIADEIGCNRSTVQCYLAKHKIKKDTVKREYTKKKQYYDEEYLYNAHYIDGLSVSEIARENGVSVDTILYFFKKNGLEYTPMFAKTTLSEDEENNIIDLYIGGESSTEIGKKYSISHRLVLRVLNRRGIERRTLSESQYNYFEKDVPSELQDKDWLIEEYVTKRKNSKDIANDLGVSPSTVIRGLKRLGIQPRSDSESKIGLMVGKNHPNYRGGITPLNGLLREFFNCNLSPKVAKRDNYTCQRCGRTHTILHVHHIVHFSEIVHEILSEHSNLNPEIEEDKLSLYSIITRDKRFLDLDNLITYCRDCHLEIHKNKSISNQPSNNDEDGSETIENK